MDEQNLFPREREFITDAKKVVEEHLAEHDFNVTKFCRYLGKSRVTSYRRLKKMLNQSSGEFIREMRLQQAARLLAEGAYQVHQVANMTGFYNHSYFSKCFRQRFGLCPSEYIRRSFTPSE